MALFSNEAEKTEKNGRPQIVPNLQSAPVTPQPSPIAPATAERELDRKDSSACAYLDQSAKVNGKLFFDGAARIDGQVEGEISAKDLTIGETAQITAVITAASVIIAGNVKGEIKASQRLEIRPTARISGEISTPKLAMHEGAVFDGRCTMQPDGARENREISALRRDKQAAQGDGRAVNS
jgi:cytoskeletal protein CcmA (bactofilin family)